MVWRQLIVANTAKRFIKPYALLKWNCRMFSISTTQQQKQQQRQKKIGIIGSGPAGFYTAQHLLKHNEDVHVDIFEKLPVPFGLVRYGVAPDHPEVKEKDTSQDCSTTNTKGDIVAIANGEVFGDGKVVLLDRSSGELIHELDIKGTANATNTFEEVARSPRCHFFGNVNIGVDIKATELQKIYDAVVFAYGADDDKRLNIPGEDAHGVYAARSFVGWYNGLPAHSELLPNLNCDTAVIVGQGNVALDVARILLAPMEMLQHTDICSHAVEALKQSQIKIVHIVGRRGPLEVSFTIKELREQIRLAGTKPVFQAEDFVPIRPKIKSVPRQRKRLIELMCKTALDSPSVKEEEQYASAEKQWELNFFKSPTKIITDHQNNVTGIQLEKNELIENEDGSLSARGTGVFEEIPCGMVLRSIGYKSIKVEDDIPFDNRLGIIPNINGRVVQAPGSKEIVQGLYCSGWVKHGPVGVIVTTMNEAFSTADIMLEDIKNGSMSCSKAVDENINDILHSKGVNFVTFEDYQQIDMEEIWRGREQKKPREKLTSAQEMLDIAFKKKKE